MKWLRQLLCKHEWVAIPYTPKRPANGAPIPFPLFTSEESWCIKCEKTVQKYEPNSDFRIPK
jgi:hypothetical protein